MTASKDERRPANGRRIVKQAGKASTDRTATASPRPLLRDAIGRTCQIVALPRVLDEQASAELTLTPHRGLDLRAPAGITFTDAGAWALALHLVGRPVVVLDDLPEPLVAALSAHLLTLLDHRAAS